jgi:hypothetical protein
VADVEADNAATAINEQDFENMFMPPECTGNDDSSVGCVETVDPFEEDKNETSAGISSMGKTPPPVTQENMEDDASFSDFLLKSCPIVAMI